MRPLALLAAIVLLPSCMTCACHDAFELDIRGTESESPTKAAKRAQAVKNSFLFAWNGYYAYAFPNDELHPVSNGFGNSRNGWGASAVDALSTACIMELKQVVNDIIAYIPTIDYSHSINGDYVSLFETTIRYLGGMLSGYDLLTGPFSYLANNTASVEALLEQSKTLANLLSYAFDTPSGIPSNNLNFPDQTDGSPTNGLATIGTLILEWTRLSDLTGNATYAELVRKAESYLVNPKPLRDEPWPGLVGTNVDLKTGKFLDASGGWIGGDDSFYEYLIKMYVYDSNRFGYLRDRWILAADSSIAHLASHPTSRPDLTFLATYDHTSLMNNSEHLACFDGGNFLLGGSVLGRQDYIDFGLQLVDGCHDTYSSTASGIGPEEFSWDVDSLPDSQVGFYNKHGFYITNSFYDLRPEVLESYYYAYKITGDTKYQDWSWQGFKAITAACKAKSGYSAIYNVNLPGGGAKNDNQESFLFAEVMKYAYLIHAPDNVYDVNHGGTNLWVFNTEAHPFKVAGPPV